MLNLTRLLEVSVELLAAIATGVFVAAAGFEELASAVGQNDGVVSVAFERDGSNQSLLAEVPEIASPRIGRAVVVVTEIASRDHPKRSDSTERARFGTAKLVLAVAIADDFTFKALGQIEVVREDVARVHRIAVALIIVAVAGIVSPPGIVEHAGSSIRLRRLGLTDPKPTGSESAKCKMDSRVCSREGSDATTRFLERRRFAERSWTG